MITSEQYFGDKPHSEEHAANCELLLRSINSLLDIAAMDRAYRCPCDPDTGTQISGAKGGSGDGGFRLLTSGTGAGKSSHKDANGCDIFDPTRALAAWCVANIQHLAALGLYMEDPRWTPGWVHLQRVPPRSGNRIYVPSTSAPLAPALPGQKTSPYSVKV